MDVDLNLLVALDALLDEGSVGGAAERLRLSQPAMSRTLGRIRRATGDQILVRAGRGMVPTPYAESVRGRVRALVAEGQGLLGPGRGVDPAGLSREFTLRCHDAVIDAAGPAILSAVRAAAPGVRVRFVAEAATDTLDLRTGRVDLEIGAADGGVGLPDVRSEVVGSGGLVVAVRAGHPIGEGGLTLAAYASAEHVVVSRRGRLHDRIDELLAEQGLARRVVASVPSGSAAFRLISNSEMLVAVPSLLARDVVPAAGLRTLPLPFDVASVAVAMSWHLRHEGDGAHAWLRGLVREVLGEVLDASR